MIIPVYNKKRQQVGHINTEKKIYETIRDAKKNQVFHFFGNGIAFDVSILENCITHNVKTLVVLVVNFEIHVFYLVSSLDFFIKHSERFNYDKTNINGEYCTGYGDQKRMPMNLWKRVYSYNDIFKMQLECQTYIFNNNKV